MEDHSVQNHQSSGHSLLTYRAYDSTSSKKIRVEIHWDGEPSGYEENPDN